MDQAALLFKREADDMLFLPSMWGMVTVTLMRLG